MAKENLLAIIGANGFVGQEITPLLESKSFAVEAADIDQVDILNTKSLDNWTASLKSDSILNLAAYTQVDKAETERDLASKINTQGAVNLTKASKKYDKQLIHISTDFIFPGTKEYPGPYKENQQTPREFENQLGWYGKTKLEAEREIMASDCKWAIVRIAFPFGSKTADEKDYIQKIIKSIKAGYSLFNDQFLTPTYIPDLAVVLGQIASKRLSGVYHVATHPLTTPFEFGSYLAKNLDLGEVAPGSVQGYLSMPGVARRPILGGYDTAYSQQKLGLKYHSWKSAIEEFII